MQIGLFGLWGTMASKPYFTIHVTAARRTNPNCKYELQAVTGITTICLSFLTLA